MFLKLIEQQNRLKGPRKKRMQKKKRDDAEEATQDEYGLECSNTLYITRGTFPGEHGNKPLGFVELVS
jgi:hypothetical protein